MLAHVHPAAGGLLCRLVLMVAHPGFPVGRPCDRQAPRAPLPHLGVTLMGKTSCAFSKGITLSSSLIRTHAPSLYPPSDFRFSPYTKGLCRLLPAPCCVKALPNAISVVLPCVPGPLLQLLPRCCFPFLPLGHWPSPSEHGSALGIHPPLLLRMANDFGAAVIPLRYGPQVCSPHR